MDLCALGIISSREYSAYGAELPGYSYTTSGEYRFQFQNQEVDEEFWGGAVSYKYRIEDPRLGRFFSVDPLAPKYAYNSVYAFSENRVIDGVELEGLEYEKAGKYENDLYVLPQDNLVNRYNHLENIKLDYERKEQKINLKSPKSIVDHVSPPARDEKNLIEPKGELGMGSGPKVPENVLPEIVKDAIEEGLKLGVGADQEGLNLQLTSLSLAFPYFYDTKEGGVNVTETSSGIDLGVFGAEKTITTYTLSVIEKPSNFLVPIKVEYKVMSVQKSVELGPVARETISTFLKMPSWKSYDLIRYEERYGLGKTYDANYKIVTGGVGVVIWSPWRSKYYRD
jgi:RHS repeat-associated protein